VAGRCCVLSHDFAGFSREQFLAEDVRCRKEQVSGGQRLYAVQLPQKHTGYLAETHSCGSGGCNFDYLLLINKEDKARYGC
jgi:hypothetical protein